jgi:hypothetical protein
LVDAAFYKTSFLEPGVREYLIRIMNTIFVVLIWLLINTTAGIMYHLAFISAHVTTGNIIFYCWLIISALLLARWAYRLWSKPIDFNQED